MFHNLKSVTERSRWENHYFKNQQIEEIDVVFVKLQMIAFFRFCVEHSDFLHQIIT